jgi:hypothetical protein
VLGAEVGYSLVGSVQVDARYVEVIGTLVDLGLSHF